MISRLFAYAPAQSHYSFRTMRGPQGPWTGAANPKFASGTVATFGFKAALESYLFQSVSFSIPKFAQKSRQMLADCGIGTL